jgi:hypothetical protein
MKLVPSIVEHGRAADRSIPATAVSAESAGNERSRAAVVASLLTATNRRERDDAMAQLPMLAAATSRTPSLSSAKDAVHMPVPVGRSFTRRSHSRVSAIAAKRDVTE